MFIGICMYVYVRICMNIHIHIHTPIHLYMRISSEVADEIPAHRRQTPDLQWAGRGGNDVEVKGRSFCRNCYLCPPFPSDFAGESPTCVGEFESPSNL